MNIKAHLLALSVFGIVGFIAFCGWLLANNEELHTTFALICFVVLYIFCIFVFVTTERL